ncbi:MAG: hypothetical protein ACFFDT_16005 [Candidatus Hodarchaeota archaeon]
MRALQGFEINVTLSFDGPSWLLKIIEAVLAPDNTKDYVKRQQIQQNKEDPTISKLLLIFTPKISVDSILIVINDIFESITLMLHLLKYFTGSD